MMKEVLETLCRVNHWDYAVFWRIGSQNPKLLIWEECFYEPPPRTTLPSIPGIQSPERFFHGLESGWVLPGQCEDMVGALINKMMLDKHVQIVGQGIVGRAAISGNHLWILSDNYVKEIHQSEVQNELYQQFSSCMKTIAVIPVLNLGVVQLGSSFSILENMTFVNDLTSLILELAYVPSAPLLDNLNPEDFVLDGVPLYPGKPVSTVPSQALELLGQPCNSLLRLTKNDQPHTSLQFHSPEPYYNVANGILQPSRFQPTRPLPNFSSELEIEMKGLSYPWLDEQATSTDLSHFVKDDKVSLINFPHGSESLENDFCQGFEIPLGYLDQPTNQSQITSGICDDSQNYTSDSKSTIDEFFQTSSGDDLLDIFGGAFKDKALNQISNGFVCDVSDSIPKASEKDNRSSLLVQDADSCLYSFKGVKSDNGGVYSSGGTGHLLDAVVSNFSSFSGSSFYTDVDLSKRKQGDLLGSRKFLGKLGVVEPISFKGEPNIKENNSQASSIYESQISYLVNPSGSMKHNGNTSNASSKRSNEAEKSNCKRVKPGDRPRPRPKDRQMIQDRMKELREIVPNGSKCSIDALLERTIKHLIFLQNVTEHADKLGQTKLSKSISKESGLLLEENFEGGRTWAYEVSSQSMICPIIVEDLNPPRQMLVEMLCEERGMFLEIANIVRGLGLTILKGVMESRNDKVWARFAVESNRDVTRVEVFVSLVNLLELTVNGNPPPVNEFGTDNPMAPQLYDQTPSIITATCGLL